MWPIICLTPAMVFLCGGIVIGFVLGVLVCKSSQMGG